MARFVLNHKENKVRYTIKGFQLLEENLYSHNTRLYDLLDKKEKLVFRTHLKRFAKFYMDLDIDAFDLLILVNLKWL